MTTSPKAVQESFLKAGVKTPALDIAFEHANGTAILSFPVKAINALERWTQLRSATDKTSWYPVITRDTQIEELVESREDIDPMTVVAAAGKVQLKKYFKRRTEEGAEIDESKPGDVKPIDSFSVPFDILTGKPASGVEIHLVPTRRGYEVPAYLPFGGWNDCPEDSKHIAVLKSWHERFGAELVTMSDSVLELQVARPPNSNAAALELAREHYAYCPDIVEQGVESVGALAAMLRRGRIWYFWWD